MRKYSKAVVNLAIAAVILLAVFLLLPRVIVFFMPFVVGWLIALIAGPLVHFFEDKVKLKRKIGSAFVIVFVIALVVLLLYFVSSWLIEQVGGLIGALPDMWSGMESDLNDIGHKFDVLFNKFPADLKEGFVDAADSIAASLGDFFGKISTPTIAAAGSFARQLPSMFIGVIMALLSAYFFVAERNIIGDWFRKHTPAMIQIRFRTVRRSLKKSVGGYLKAQLKIEVWMYLLLLIGLGLLKVDYFALIALLIAFMDFLPFFGTGTVLIPWAVIKVLTGDFKMAIWLLVMWGVGQLARQLIQPKIVGDSIGVPPLPTLILLYIGYKIGGIVGMIIAVPLGLLIYTMYQEGAFDTTKNSLLILVSGINRFRRLKKEDLADVQAMAATNEELMDKIKKEKSENIETF
ncbi:MAG: sporulation integral membrane protein YtvI [Lachnospiraceae bacterium]|nr:sporulation integral membrane protein YtvI [Butyrivibrio sp.]MCM1344810.1 sporulation integral membrane protein YtvI [Muribaculaceae bacterium]MCM1410699.1 sporulation integral membrane protein YtvI [Lachnospiraceae bacterium]